jgi:hypothetical protein
MLSGKVKKSISFVGRIRQQDPIHTSALFVPLPCGPRAPSGPPVDLGCLCEDPLVTGKSPNPCYRALTAEIPSLPHLSGHLITCQLLFACSPVRTPQNELFPHSTAPARTLSLPLCHRDARTSRSMTSRAQHAAASHGLPPAVRGPPRRQAVHSRVHRPRVLPPLGARRRRMAASTRHLAHFPARTPTRGQCHVAPHPDQVVAARWPLLPQLQRMCTCARPDSLASGAPSADSAEPPSFLPSRNTAIRALTRASCPPQHRLP